MLLLTARTSDCLPFGGRLRAGGNAGSLRALVEPAARYAAQVTAERVAREAEEARIRRDAGFAVDGLDPSVRAQALADIAAAGAYAAWSIVASAYAADKALRFTRAAHPSKRGGVAVRWTSGWGEGGAAAHAARVARVMKAAGASKRESTVAACCVLVEARSEVSESRAGYREAAKKQAARERPLSKRLAEGIPGAHLPRALRTRLSDYRAAFVRAFRWPKNAAQSGASCSSFLGARGRVSQEVGREWVKYSAREGSHQATTADAHVLVSPAVLAREALWQVDGVVTVDLRAPVCTGEVTVWEGTFARQGRGVSIETAEGFLAVHANGTAAHGKTASGARRMLAAHFAALRAEREVCDQAAAEVEARAGVLAALAAAVGRTPSGTEGIRLAQLQALLASMDREVTVATSLASGNCELGSRAWAGRNLPAVDPENPRATVREVLAAAWTTRDQVERAVRAAVGACVRPDGPAVH